MDSIVKKINIVYELLVDEWSKSVFENRIRFPFVYKANVVDGGVYDGYDFYSDSTIPYIERRYEKNTKFVIAGAGYRGKHLLMIMRHAGYEVEYFVDNDIDKQGTIIEGVSVISFEELCLNHVDMIVIIANPTYGRAFIAKLREYQYPEKNIIYCENGCVYSKFGNEYFDVPIHCEGTEEVYVDAGCFDGADCLNFIEWCKGEYDHIYAFEAGKGAYRIAQNRLKDIKNATVYNQCLGEMEGTVKFYEDNSHPEGSRVCSSVGEIVRVVNIDKIFKDKKVTFIKMDVEGQELEVLRGGVNTIRNNRPILAISCYHNELDILEIPLYINSLNLDYKFYMRHYSSSKCGLVLYCI